MKETGRLNGGTIASESYPALADYLVRYLHQYADWDLPIAAVSPQNKPLLSRGNYPSALLPATEEARFIHDSLSPALRRSGQPVGILRLDHNRADWAYALTLAGHRLRRKSRAMPPIASAALPQEWEGSAEDAASGSDHADDRVQPDPWRWFRTGIIKPAFG